MKKIFVLSILCALFSVCLAQTASTKKTAQPKVSSTKESQARKPTGPTGIGALVIGLTKEQVEALRETDGTYLTSTMAPYTLDKEPLAPGVDKYQTFMRTPLSETPFMSVLEFEGGRLSSIYINFGDETSTVDRVIAQITQKYGAGSVTDDRKEEQCIYKNGANFKIAKGGQFTSWNENISQDELIQTTTTDYLFDMCPSNLRIGGTNAKRLASMSIAKKKPVERPKNPF